MKHLFCALMFLTAAALGAIEVRVQSGNEAFTADIPPETTLAEIAAYAESLTGEPALEILVQKGAVPRNYNQEVTDKEKKEMAFIIKTLAFKPLTKVYKEKTELQKAGDRIDHIHPYRFLMTIFTDEELLVGIRAIRKRGWVWSEFAQGFKNSFKEEVSHGNVTAQQLNHFSSAVGVNASILSPAISAHQWEEFIDLLIEHVKRNDDSGRYDM